MKHLTYIEYTIFVLWLLAAPTVAATTDWLLTFVMLIATMLCARVAGV